MSLRNGLDRPRCCIAASFAAAAASSTAPQPPPPAVLFENVRIFDGTSARLSAPSNVLVVGNLIQSISSQADRAAGRDRRLPGSRAAVAR